MKMMVVAVVVREEEMMRGLWEYKEGGLEFGREQN